MTQDKKIDNQEMHRLDLTDAYGSDMHTYESVSWKDHALLYFIFVTFVLLTIWASFAELDEVARANGKIIPISEVKQIQSLEGGIISKLLVSEGQSVKAGDPLVKMDNVQASSDFQSSNTRYLSLLATITRLQAEARGAETLEFNEELIKKVPDSVQTEMQSFLANQKAQKQQSRILKDQLRQRQAAVEQNRKQISDLNRILSLTQKEIDMRRPAVEKGFVSKLDLLKLEQQFAQQEADLNNLKLALPQAQSAVAEARERLAAQKSDAQASAQQQLTQYMTEMKTLKETLGALKAREQRTEIKAPVSGTVKDIRNTTIGGIIQPGAVIMEIVPDGEALLIEANVRPEDIAFVHNNQEAIVKVTAYDYSVYGGLDGSVVDISADTIVDEQGQSFYRVKVITHRKQIVHHGNKLQIKPGMVVSVDILTGKKTVMDYILKPLKKTLTTAMTER
jgi:adhesin transport system membrane fusion protein